MSAFMVSKVHIDAMIRVVSPSAITMGTTSPSVCTCEYAQRSIKSPTGPTMCESVERLPRWQQRLSHRRHEPPWKKRRAIPKRGP